MKVSISLSELFMPLTLAVKLLNSTFMETLTKCDSIILICRNVHACYMVRVVFWTVFVTTCNIKNYKCINRFCFVSRLWHGIASLQNQNFLEYLKVRQLAPKRSKWERKYLYLRFTVSEQKQKFLQRFYQ